MKIYSFWSADTTYYTTSKNLKKAQKIGQENFKHYLNTCKYLEDEPEKLSKDYFIPKKLEEEKPEWFAYSAKNDKNIMILDDELYSLLS